MSRGGVKVELWGVGTMRGSIEGSLWALVLGGAGLGFASLVAAPPMTGEPPATPQLVAPQSFGASPTTTELTPFTAEADSVVIQNAPQVSAPVADDSAPSVDTASVTPPQTAPVEADLAVPESDADPAVASAIDTPVTSGGIVEAPAQPADEAVVSVDTDVAAAVEEPAPQEETEVTVAAEAETAEPVVPEITEPAVIVADEASEDATVAEVVEPETPAIAEDVAEPAADESAPTIVEAEDAAEPQEVIAEVTEAPAEEVAPAEEPAEAPAADTVQTQTTTANVRVNRPSEEPSETAGEGATIVTPDDIPDDAPALLRFAAGFENPDDVPAIALILLDDGTMADAAGAVTALGFAPTVALNASTDNVSAKVQDYRAAGAEVAMQITLPNGAQPTDVEVAFEAAFGLMPEVAMLFSDGDGVLSNDRDVTSQAMQVLKAEGHGFVAVQKGLGRAVREAEQAEVPAVAVLRDIDGAGEDQRAIARALDQAAFRARQSGGAVLLGRMTPDTLAALQEWAADLDPEQLRVAPVSAILLAGGE